MSQISPLYAFDNQLCDILTTHLSHESLNSLIMTGDGWLTRRLVPSIKMLCIKNILQQERLLSLSIASNLQRLTISCFRQIVARKNVCKILDMIKNSRLESLSILSLEIEAGQQFALTLPATLKKLVMFHLTWSTDSPYDYIVLNGARLESISLSYSSCSSHCDDSFWPVRYFADQVIGKSCESLVSLCWAPQNPLPLDLGKHTSIKTLSIKGIHLDNRFVSPPNLSCLVYRGFINFDWMIPAMLAIFPKSLARLDLSKADGMSYIIDIGSLCNIERFILGNKRYEITCAPAKNLVIECKWQPFRLNNIGTGSVSIEAECLVIEKHCLYHGPIFDALCWPLLKVLHFGCPPTYPLCAYPVDMNVLCQAINIQSIYIEGDSVANFAQRDGHQYLNLFPKLSLLDWSLDIDLCDTLASLAFSLPHSLKHLRIQLLGQQRVMSKKRKLIHTQWINANGGQPFVLQPSIKSGANQLYFTR